MQGSVELEALEVKLLLQAVYEQYGYDFRNYALASITRRLRQHASKAGVETIADLIPAVLHDPLALQPLILDLSLTVTEMFRDPSFYTALRERVMPFLRTYPFINVWHAGCATGEEVYSLAIVLVEEGLYERCRIYATDFNDEALLTARNRIYPLDKMREYTTNYQQTGGKRPFSDYYHAQFGAAVLDSALQRNVTFASHNLVTDAAFAEMHLILCRNVLIYFDRTLQARVLTLLRDSLCHGGFLGLGNKETLQFSAVRDDFREVVANERIYQYDERRMHGG